MSTGPVRSGGSDAARVAAERFRDTFGTTVTPPTTSPYTADAASSAPTMSPETRAALTDSYSGLAPSRPPASGSGSAPRPPGRR